jgi:hypothetical protein
MAGEGQTLPQLNLGEIGTNYTLVPAEISVEVPAGGLGTAAHELIWGNTLENCEDWKGKVRFVGAGHFEAICTTQSMGGGRLLAGEVKALVIRGESSGTEETKTRIVPIVIGVVAGVVVVGVVIGVAVWLRKRKQGMAIAGATATVPA